MAAASHAAPTLQPPASADDRPASTLALSSPLEIQAALADWKRDTAQIGQRRSHTKAGAAAASSPAAAAVSKLHASPIADPLSQSSRRLVPHGSGGSASSSLHSSPHSSPLKAHIPASVRALHSALFASTVTPPDSPVAPLVPTASPPRSKHGLRLQAAAQAQIEAAAAKSKPPVKRKLADQLSAVSSPARPVAASASAPSTPLTPFGMTMLRSPAAAAAASPSPGGSGSTPSKRHRLDTAGILPNARVLVPPSSSIAAAAAASSAASSPAAPARPFYSMPAHPLTPSALFPRSASPPAARSAPRSAGSRPSPSKKNLFGAMLSGHNTSGLTSGKPKRLRDAAALTPGLHHSKGIFSYTMSDDCADDRAKKAEAIRAYEEWMDTRRKNEMAEQQRQTQQQQQRQQQQKQQQQAANNQANAIQPQDEDEQDEEEDAASNAESDADSCLESDAELELLITGTDSAATSTAAVMQIAAASSASSSSAAAATVVSSAVVVTSASVISAASLVPLVPFSAFAAALLTPTALALQSVLDPASLQAQEDITLEPLSSPDGEENL